MAAPEKDVKERVMGQKRFLEDLETMVPGFSGYKNKELRREADKLLRERLASELRDVDESINETYESIVDSKITDAYEGMDAAAALMDKVISKVEVADYGYAGFFDSIKIREDALDAVYEFDKALFEEIEALESKADELSEAVESDEKGTVKRLVKELKKAVMEFDKKFDKRRDVMLKLE